MKLIHNILYNRYTEEQLAQLWYLSKVSFRRSIRIYPDGSIEFYTSLFQTYKKYSKDEINYILPIWRVNGKPEPNYPNLKIEYM